MIAIGTLYDRWAVDVVFPAGSLARPQNDLRLRPVDAVRLSTSAMLALGRQETHMRYRLTFLEHADVETRPISAT